MSDKSNNFYCQKNCGEVDFSIEEWNKAQEEMKTLTPEQLDFVMQPETICQEQCADCIRVVTETRISNRKRWEEKNILIKTDLTHK